MNEKNSIVDFHTHLFPPEFRQNREKYFAGESAFELLYASPKSKMIGAKEMIASMDEGRRCFRCVRFSLEKP